VLKEMARRYGHGNTRSYKKGTTVKKEYNYIMKENKRLCLIYFNYVKLREAILIQIT
jgi:hypothetical protein